MKRLLITLLLALFAVATVVLWREWPCLFPSSEVNELYRRYEHNDHIRATSIKDFQVNDTLTADVVTLQADNDSAWYGLLLDVGLSEEVIDFYNSEMNLIEGEYVNSIIMFTVDKNNIKNRMDIKDFDCQLAIGSFTKKTICIFITGDEKTKEIIKSNEIKKLKT